jgi:trehalose 2-sulfotransferase
METHTSYAIYRTPRTGSNLLGEALLSTGVAGNPKVHFTPRSMAILTMRWPGLDDSTRLRSMLQELCTPNGVFGTQLAWHHHLGIIEGLLRSASNAALSASDLMADAFPSLRYVWLTRRDKLRQAISHCKALQTGAWVVRKEDLGRPRREPRFDFDEIQTMIRGTERVESKIAQYFDTHGIQPLRIEYEDLAADVEGVTIRVLQHIGIAPPYRVHLGPRAPLRLADAQTEEWVQRFQELAKLSAPGNTSEG